MTNRNSPPRAEGAQGSFDCRREAPGGPRTGPQLQAELRPKAIPDHGPVRGPLDPDRRPEAGAPSRPRASCRSAVRGSRPSGFRGCRSYDRRGVAPSPTLRPKAETPVREHATEAQRCQRISSTVTSEGYAHRYAIKGGLTYFRTNVAPTMTPARANYSRESGRCRAWSKTPGRAPMHGGGAALS